MYVQRDGVGVVSPPSAQREEGKQEAGAFGQVGTGALVFLPVWFPEEAYIEVRALSPEVVSEEARSALHPFCKSASLRSFLCP